MGAEYTLLYLHRSGYYFEEDYFDSFEIAQKAKERLEEEGIIAVIIKGEVVYSP